MKIWIPYTKDNVFAHVAGQPEGEWVEAERALFPPSGEPVYDEHARFRLTSFARSVPLVPGDIVWAETRTQGLTLLSIIELAPLWVFEVFENTPNLMRAPGLHDPDNWNVAGLDDSNWAAAEIAADQMIADFARATAVQRTTNFTVRLATESRIWFDRAVADHPHVDFYSVVRKPGQPFDLDHELRDLGASAQPMFDKHGERLS